MKANEEFWDRERRRARKIKEELRKLKVKTKEGLKEYSQTTLQ